MTTPTGLLSGSLGSSSVASAASTTVAQSSKAGLSRVATDLTRDASVVVALNASSSSALTYNAAGLLNTLAQPENVAAPAEVSDTGTNTESPVQQAMDQASVGALPASSTPAGIYTASGTFQGMFSAKLSASWTAILQSNPELAGTVVASSLARGMTRTLIASV